MATTIVKTEKLSGQRLRRKEDPRLITGTATYELKFQWVSNHPVASTDTVTLTVTDVNGHQEVQTYSFYVPSGTGNSGTQRRPRAPLPGPGRRHIQKPLERRGSCIWRGGIDIGPIRRVEVRAVRGQRHEPAPGRACPDGDDAPGGLGRPARPRHRHRRLS